MKYKDIHIGSHIKYIAELKKISPNKASKHFECSQRDIINMYNQQSLKSDVLLEWCKLLNYNFFMFYNSHLQIYKPSASVAKINKNISQKHTKNTVINKNLYMPEIIDWILQQLEDKKMTAKDIMHIYNIPRTTIYRWKRKASNRFR